jgi:type II secretory pathway pseudopilin PulG
MSRNAAGFVAVNVTTAVVLAGILGMSVSPRLARMRDRMLEVEVRQNCYTVQIAAEAYAGDNYGVYSPNVTGLMGYLPDGSLLRNPYHGARTEPVDASAANPGETGYVPANAWGFNYGYNITGFGRTRQIVELTNFDIE